MKGRPRKPSRQRLLEGNPGRRPIPVEPALPVLGGGIPDWLPADAGKLWSEFFPKFQNCIFTSELDGPMIALLCSTWDLSMRSLRKLQREGLTRNGRKNPAATIWRQNVGLFMQIASRFGMSPADRARLFAGHGPEKDPGGDTLDGNWKPYD